MIKEYNLSELGNLKIHGRTNGELDPLTLLWTASGIEMNFKGSELRIRYKADYQQFEPWIDIIIDGNRYQKRPLEKGTHEITIWRSSESRNNTEAPIRNIRILRDTPAMPTDGRTLFQIEKVIADGTFEVVDDNRIKLEFIGDSITSGEGRMGTVFEQDWNSSCFDAIDNYAYMTASNIGADYNVFSQSGWGICWSWNGYEKESIPPYYEQICGLIPEEAASELSADNKWDFNRFQPDFVIINLGTNDAIAFNKDAHTAAQELGRINSHNLTEEGKIPVSDADHIKATIISFLKLIRDKNRASKIIWAYGMLNQESEILNDQMKSILEGAVESYRNVSGYSDAYYLQLPVNLNDGFGSRSHPGHISHQNAACVLTEMIRKLSREGLH